MPPRRNESLVDLLLEVQGLDRVPRAGWLLRGVADAESVAEHSFHVALLVWTLGAQVPDLDVARAVSIALLHDLAELRLGDLPLTASDYLPPGAKHAAERTAFADLAAPAGERAVALFAEYEAAASREARFVHACDKLQLMLKVTVYESWGTGALAEFWANPDNFPPSEFAPVDAVLAELRKRRETSRRA